MEGSVVKKQVNPELVQDILENFLRDGHIEIGAWSFGNHQRLDLDNAKYEGYLSAHGIEIFMYNSKEGEKTEEIKNNLDETTKESKDKTEKKKTKDLVWKETFVVGFPTCLKSLVKEREKCEHFQVEFLDMLDRQGEFEKYKKWKTSLNSESQQQGLEAEELPEEVVAVLQSLRQEVQNTQKTV